LAVSAVPHDAATEAPRRPLPEALLAALRSSFGERCSTAEAVRLQHGRDESPFPVTPPDAVVFCESTDEVAAVVRLAGEHRMPIIPYGAGSSLEGHLLAVQGGVSIDLSRLARVLRIDADDLTATVEAGVTREQLNAELRSLGLFFPVDPGANASIGGMAATRASGTNAVRYGTMRENVLALTVVTGRGELVRTGTRARKSAAGYDLTRLFVGSEGTLGVMTELTVKLVPLPEAVSAAVCHFPDVASAVRTTIQTIQLGVPIARCELLDVNAVRAVNRQSGLALREAPMLLMEFHGSPASVKEQAETVQAIADELGGEGFEWADTPEERSRLWAARHRAYFAGLQQHPGTRSVTTDTCVPISRLAEIVEASVADAEASGLPYYIVGHVGDGNFHLAYLVREGDAAQRATAEAMSERMVRRTIAMEGTCSGEHGVGLHKMSFLEEEAGAGGIALMRTLKQALDPLDILNPGKIFRR
jgi:D-lactate dehydrogenase (cytochrome)